MGSTTHIFICVAFVGTIVAAEQVIYAEKQPLDCPAGMGCYVGLGNAGKVKLPALVALKSAHNHYVSVSPPNGGSPHFTKNNPQKWEEWEMIRIGDKVAIQSHHGTFLSQRFHPTDGYEMTAEKLPHEMFEIGEPMGHATSAERSTIHIKGHNGMFLSAGEDGTLRQEPTTEHWELFHVETLPSGKVAIRSVAHGTYLSASAPEHYGVVLQQEDINLWESFVMDSVDTDKITLESNHGTFLSAHADEWHAERVITSERAVMWEFWTPYVNATAGKVCLQAHDGRFLFAAENVFEGLSMAPHCMEHEQFEIVLVTDKMLAEAKKREEARKAQAAMAPTPSA